MSIVHVSAVRSQLGWKPDRDAEAQLHLDAAEALWPQHTGGVLLAATNLERTIQFDRIELSGQPVTRRFPLPVRDITAFTLVAWGNEDTPPADYATPLIEGTDYLIDKRLGVLTMVSYSGIGWLRYKVTGGWSATTIPPNVKLAIIAQAVYSQKKNDPANIHVRYAAASGSGSVGFQDDEACITFQRAAEGYRRYDF